MHRPVHTLLFILLVFGLVLGIGHLLPPEMGVGASLRLRFPRADVFFWEKPAKKDISSVLRTVEVADSALLITDPHQARDTAERSEGAKKDSLVKLITSLQYRDGAAMEKFYRELGALRGSGKTVRVMHYGDSQIEGDRMTGYLREKFQMMFGGSGTGLTSMLPLTQNVFFTLWPDGDWERYSAANARDPRVKHSRYGPLINFSRFKPYGSDSSLNIAELLIRPGKNPRLLSHDKMKLWYGGARAKTWCALFRDGEMIDSASLAAGGYANVKQFAIPDVGSDYVLKFAGKDSPDFYGISFEGESGLLIDNIALRGSSGTFFHIVDGAQLRDFYKSQNVRLVILQFGGNALPAITDSTILKNYGDYMRAQITILKRLAPDASVLFIGPSDMSVKSGTDYVTHPFLEPLRDKLREVAFSTGCAFFDIYDCMGGENSMPAWVDKKLAASDYTHFSPVGARKIAALLYQALLNDYSKFRDAHP